MPWTIFDHKASAVEAIARGIISGNPAHLAEVPEPQQSSEHQARVAVLSVLNELGGPAAVVTTPWTSDPPVEPPSAPVPPTSPPVNGWGDGAVFGSRPAQSQPIHLQGETGLVIENLSFGGDPYIYRSGRGHNTHVCILLTDCQNITVRNCDFADVSEPVAVIGGSDILVEYNRTDGIIGPGSRVDEQTGNFLQTVQSPSRVHVRHNKIIVSTDTDPWSGQYERLTEDVISLFSASDCVVEFNQIDATGYIRDYGTGIIAGDARGDRHTIRGNTLLNPGQVGLATAGGFGHRFYDNILYKGGAENPGSGNTAAYFWGYQGNPIGDGVYRGNRANWIDGGGFWNPGGAVEEGNDWSDASIDPADLAVIL